MKLARELSKRQTGRTLYLLDEPTTGLHFDDVRKLLEVLHRLTDLGNTVIIIEHNLDIVRNADYVLDMGPEGGERGGRIIAHGTPEEIATVAGSYTGSFLARHYASGPLGAGPLHVNGSGPMSSAAGPQPLSIAAAPDRVKASRGKFVAPEKKTGVPTARAEALGAGAKRTAPAKAAKKSVAVRRRRSA
jgi:excinuclease ABC subunit A